MKPDATTTRKRYDRIAPFYDLLEAPMEGLFLRPWRERLWAKVSGHHILEVGVGTGKNFAFYPKDARVTAIDFSPLMLKQAALARARKATPVELALMDVQALDYADNSFDTIVSSCVFCSVPLPNKGLKELFRVCKPGGQVLLLEHVISAKPKLAAIMNFLDPLVVRLVGAHINRDTVKNVKACSFSSVRLDKESGDIFKLIEATK